MVQHTHSKLSEIEIKRAIPFTIAAKIYPGIGWMQWLMPVI
jgi:hypothetical protein